MVTEMGNLREWVTKNLKKYNINFKVTKIKLYVFQEFLVTFLIL